MNTQDAERIENVRKRLFEAGPLDEMKDNREERHNSVNIQYIDLSGEILSGCTFNFGATDKSND